VKVRAKDYRKIGKNALAPLKTIKTRLSWGMENSKPLIKRFRVGAMCVALILVIWFFGYTAAPTLHEELLVLDAHLDTPAVLDRPGFDITQRHDPHHDFSQVDLPRMQEGGLDGGFWVIYTPQGPLTEDGFRQALEHARHRNQLIDAMVAENPDDFAHAILAEQAASIAAQGKRVVFKSIENAYPLGMDVSRLDEFYDRGVRMLGLVHMSNNQFADSSTDKNGPKWGGLSPLGRQLVARANQLGMVIDASHAHDATLAQLLELSTTPIILSHSGAHAVFEHPRNVPDALLLDLAETGGVIHINSLSGYLKKLQSAPERRPALMQLYGELRQNPPQTKADQDQFIARRRAIDEQFPPDYADFDDVMAHIDHVLSRLGPDHIGMGLDWDGGGGVDALHDITALPKITQAMRKAGYDKAQISALWSGNLLRLVRLAHAARQTDERAK
jgi:membrane dipeptidase